MLRGRGHIWPAAAAVWAGSVLGCALAYWAGAGAISTLDAHFGVFAARGAFVEAARSDIARHGAWAVFLAMLSPAPVQFASFAAGAVGTPWGAALAAIALGRGLRYGVMALVVYGFGGRIVAFWRRLSTTWRRVIILLASALFVFVFVASLYALFARPPVDAPGLISS